MGEKKRILYSFYDYKTGKSELRQGDATIHDDGSAVITNQLFGNMKFQPGEYLLAEHFSLYWKRCIEQLATDRVKEIKEKEGEAYATA